MSDECIFCKIAAGEIPASKVYEDERVVAFLDIAPVNPGHVLVIPRQHARDIGELSPEDTAACALAARKVACAVLEATGWPGLNLLQNNGRCAGQVVEHCHLHIIPRSPDDGFDFGWRQGRYGEGQMEELCRKISERIS
jgi:histidine triad (HIT) family protein